MAGSFALGTLVTTLGVNSKPLLTAEKQVATFANRTNTLMASVRRTMMSVFATVGVGRLAKGFLDAAVSVENYKVSLNAVIKDAQKTEAVFQDLFKWASINPIDTDDAIKSFVRLKTAGVENTRAAVAAAADAATVMQKPVEYVANAMVSTNNKMLRQIGVQLDRTGKTAIIRSGKVRIEVEKDIDKIRQGIIEVLEKNFAGAMDTFKNTWRGSLNIMKGLWWTFMAEVMGTNNSGGPYETLVKGINRVRDAWVEWKETTDYTEFVANTQAVFSAMIDGMISGIEMLVKSFGWLLDNIEMVKTAIIVFASARVMGLLIRSFAFLRTELIAGSEATSLFMKAIYALRLAFLELRTANTILGGLKGALIALGLTPGGLLIGAIGGLVLLAENLKKPFQVAYDEIRRFKQELRTIPVDKIKEIVDLSHSMGGFGMGGNYKASIAQAVQGETSRTLAEIKTQAGKMKAMWNYIKQKGYGDKIYVEPEIPDQPSMGGGESKYKKLIQQMKDEAKYLGANVQAFLPILDQWASKMKPLSEDWKLIKDYAMEIRTGMAKEAGKEAADTMKRLEEQIKLQKEAREAAEQGVEKFWSTAANGFSQGLIKGQEYFQMLTNEFEKLKEAVNAEAGGLLNMEDVFNWSDQMLARFSELQSVGEHLANLDLSNLNNQIDKGLMSKKEWVKQVELLIQKYGELPLVVEMLRKELEKATDSSKQFNFSLLQTIESFGENMVDALASSIAYGEDLGDTMRRLAQDIAYATLKAILLRSIMGIFGGGKIGVGGGKIGVGGGVGGVVPGGSVLPLARGGIVDRPTIFPMAHGLGLMGEAGPEAVMPLTRTAGGELGVKAEGNGGGETHITMNINAVDSRSFVEMMRTNRVSVESIVVENIMKNGTVRSAIRGLA